MNPKCTTSFLRTAKGAHIPSAPDPYDFSDLLTMGRSELREHLVQTVSELATMHEHVAFIRATSPHKDEYIEAAGHRDALVEQKWLILRLLDLVGVPDAVAF